MKTKSLHFLLFVVLSSLACGLTPKGDFTAQNKTIAPEMSTQVTVEMVVVDAPEGLRVRPEAGDLSTYTRVLHNGDSVTCRKFETVGDSVWCLHEYGWSNVRYLEAK